MNFIRDDVSTHDNVYDVLKERGFIEQVTHEEEVRDLLGKEKIKFYIGFDPTADSLHVGHFMQVIIMMYMQKYGHTPVVLLGGGTGMVPLIGDHQEERILPTYHDDAGNRTRKTERPLRNSSSASLSLTRNTNTTVHSWGRLPFPARKWRTERPSASTTTPGCRN